MIQKSCFASANVALDEYSKRLLAWRRYLWNNSLHHTRFDSPRFLSIRKFNEIYSLTRNAKMNFNAEENELWIWLNVARLHGVKMLTLFNGAIDDSGRNYVGLCSDVSILYVRAIQFRNGVRSTDAVSIATRFVQTRWTAAYQFSVVNSNSISQWKEASPTPIPVAAFQIVSLRNSIHWLWHWTNLFIGTR